MSFYASLRKEVLELVRTHRLLVMAVILIFFGLASPLIAKLMPEMMRLIPGGEDFVSLIPTPTISDAIAQYVKNLSLFGLLLAFLMTMGAVAQEKERGTAVLMLVKPLPRAIFLLTKFVALALAFLGCLALAGLGGYYYTMLLFATPDLSAWVVLNLLMWLYFLVYVALILLASTIAKSQAAAAGLGIGAIVILGALPSLPGLGKYLPGQLVTWGTTLFADPSARSWPALGISLGLIAACLVAAWIILDRQEI
jgi:ABC-2 type transport system permease protein